MRGRILKGITRLKTPASLFAVNEDGEPYEVTSRDVYEEMHGYLPIPYTSHRVLFDHAASRDQAAFVIQFGYPAAYLNPDGNFQIRIDLLSAEPASDAMLGGLMKTASQLFADKLGEDILCSSGGVCGIGINCSNPQRVTATRMTVRNLLDEFVAEADTLLDLSKSAIASLRASHSGLICWLTYSLEHLLPTRTFAGVDSLMKALQKCGNRMPASNDEKRCRKLLGELKTALRDLR
jgi:hypothetical protein